ncbi:hypothetical protein Mext_3786 [Methylorubrum extorquens PA1]|nr:hypothetical protein Mext_3786 [Methylorubrum extorquens PA1]
MYNDFAQYHLWTLLHLEEPAMTTAGATASDSPYIKGRNARLYGKQRESCPYPDGSEDREGWLEGYDGASTPEAEIDLGTVDDLTKR